MSGFIGRPSWTSLPSPTVAELGEWQYGRQYYASSSLEHHFRETVVFAQSSAAHLAHLRSHAGRGASVWPYASSNWSGIHVVTTSFPHNDLGTNTAPIGHCRSSLRVRWFRRQFGKAPCSMSTVGENFSSHVPGSRRCGGRDRLWPIPFWPA